jgi:hypothetical protein
VECTLIRQALLSKYSTIVVRFTIVLRFAERISWLHVPTEQNIFTTYTTLFSGDPCGMSGAGFNEIILGCYILEPLISSLEDSSSTTAGSEELRQQSYAQFCLDNPLSSSITAEAAPHVPLADLTSLRVPKMPKDAKVMATSPRYH